MTTEDPQERRRRRRMIIAWVLFFLAPALLLEAWFLGAAASIEDGKVGATPQVVYWRLGSRGCFLGGVGAVVGFIALSLKYGKPPGSS